MVALVTFRVRWDKKSHKLLVQSVKRKDQDNVFYFKDHYQHLDRHHPVVQNTIKSHNVKRCKLIHMDIEEILCEYYDCTKQRFVFDDVELISDDDLKKKRFERKIRKEEGKLKRQETLMAKKNMKAIKRAMEEEAFQRQRIQRINHLIKEIEQKKNPQKTPGDSANQNNQMINPNNDHDKMIDPNNQINAGNNDKNNENNQTINDDAKMIDDNEAN
jgi:hypothetical protein